MCINRAGEQAWPLTLRLRMQVKKGLSAVDCESLSIYLPAHKDVKKLLGIKIVAFAR